jgi:hypothetical protein
VHLTKSRTFSKFDSGRPGNRWARGADGKVTAWLDVITSRAPDAPILLVATHGDENSPAALPHDLPDRYPAIAAVCTVDSCTGLGINKLHDAIVRCS